MALGTIYPLKVTIIAAVGTMVGVLAAVMGFSAERKRNTADKLVWVDSENRCYIPPSQTVSLSIMAGLLLLLSQVGFTVAGGCLCCNRKINKFTGPAPLALKSLILSWASCVVAVIFFFYGAGVSSNHHARVNAKALPGATSASCGYAINAGVFAGGALVSLLGTVSGATYYLAVSRMDMNWADHLKPQTGIELGQPTAPAAVALHGV
ncbi:hypothetical protein M758_3G120000 [Ceratodon purpureus]|uniref:Uncharacterized protein n=1 Tax=Ceratodon purpureus TaxID=3225 RepID=A0A8T0IJL3_CERPU|nr:hypothetical protein KC19_3G118500 [Ceratodon purpureus]KAG0622740.1 hypothetical protein M758_3G120000 [Ceratodon purpureus]